MDIYKARSAKPMLIGFDGDAFDSPEYVFEIKLDGERCLAYLGDGETFLTNRRGKPVLANFPELHALHRQVGGRCILDGELITGTGTIPDFENIKQRSLVKHPGAIERLSRECPAVFVAIDILYRQGKQLTMLPLWERQETLERTIRESPSLVRSKAVAEHGVAFFSLAKKQGLEGIIGKRLDSLYHMGMRTREWIKIKNWLEDTFVVCGYIPAANDAVVTLVLGQYSSAGELVYKGKVALGVKRNDFARIAAQTQTRSHPFTARPRDVKPEVIWLPPKLVCRVRFMCWTEGLRMRQPFYQGLVDMPASQVRETPPVSGCHVSVPALG